MSCSRADPRASTLPHVAVGLVLLAGAIVPSVAQAWTRAQVREVGARLEIEASGRAQVELDLTVAVEGGWLERLELPGLDEGLELTPEPAWIAMPGGERAPARAELAAGVLVLRFARRALRRGIHRVHVQYATHMAVHVEDPRAGFGRVTWTLPGWEAALSAAEIVVLGPEGLRALVEPEAAAEVQSTMEGGRRRVRFRRVHVPRGSPWPVTLELPRPAPASVAPEAGAGVVGGAPAAPRTTGLVLGTVIGFLVSWGRRRSRAWLLTLGYGSRPRWTRFRLPWWALSGLCSLSGASWAWWPSLSLLGWTALIALGLERPATPLRALSLGRFEPPGRHALRALSRARMREQGGLASGDPASALGLLLVVLSLAGLSWAEAPFAPGDPWGLGVLCALLAVIASSRLWQPRSLAEQVQLLLRAARRTRVEGCALSLLWYVAGATRGHPRLRLLPRARYAGLLQVELLADTRRSAPALVLSVLVESDSPAARWVPGLWPEVASERSAGGARTAFLRPVADVSGALESLFEHFTRESQRALVGHAPEERAA